MFCTFRVILKYNFFCWLRVIKRGLQHENVRSMELAISKDDFVTKVYDLKGSCTSFAS